MINHPPVEGACNYGWGVANEERNDDLLNRLCDYYAERETKDTVVAGSFEWDGIIASHNEFIELLKKRDLEKLHDYLRFMFSKPLCQGTAQGQFFYDKLIRDIDEIQKNTGFAIYDKFLSLMEANGIIPTFSPEEYQRKNDFLKFYTIDPDNYIDMLERSFECDLSAPKYQGNHFGIRTERHGVYSDRDIMALSVAIKVKETYWNRKDIRIADLGGGVGHLVYWLRKLGFENITYVDLPTTTISAMYFLETNGIDNVTFVSPDEFDGDYDLVLNVDGLTQYSRPAAEAYVAKIESKAKHFMSINREFDEFRVSDICNMRRISRNQYWLRRGYVEEDYVPGEQ
jgi:hypothetical protein